MRIHIFQHVSYENEGNIKEWATTKNHTLSYTYFFDKNYTLPNLENIDGLIILGGYMNVEDEDEFEWLREEKAFIKKAIQKKIKILGICLGSQLIASELGATITRNEETEIGFFPISFNSNAKKSNYFEHFPEKTTVFHWHSNTFSIAENVSLIATSKACLNQSYQFGNFIIGLQFHLEVEKQNIETMIKYDYQELEQEGKYIQNAFQINEFLESEILLALKKDFHILLNRFFKLKS